MWKSHLARVALILALFLLFNAVIGVALAVVIAQAAAPPSADKPFAPADHPVAWGIGAGVADVLLCLLLWASGLVRRKPAPRAPAETARHGLCALASFLLCAVGINLVLSPLHLSGGDTPQLFRSMASSPLCLLTMVVLAPLTEELCFREGVQRELAQALPKRGAWLPVLLSALCFAVVHGNWAQAVPSFLLGLLLGLLYARAGNIRLSFAAHVLNNLLAVVSLRRPGVDAVLSGTAELPDVLTGLLLVLVGIALLRLWWQKTSPCPTPTNPLLKEKEHPQPHEDR